MGLFHDRASNPELVEQNQYKRCYISARVPLEPRGYARPECAVIDPR